MSEELTNDERAKISLACRKRGCGGEIEVPDAGEIHDGTEGWCPICRRVYFATEYTDGTMAMEYDAAETRRYQKELAARPR